MLQPFPHDPRPQGCCAHLCCDGAGHVGACCQPAGLLLLQPVHPVHLCRLPQVLRGWRRQVLRAGREGKQRVSVLHNNRAWVRVGRTGNGLQTLQSKSERPAHFEAHAAAAGTCGKAKGQYRGMHVWWKQATGWVSANYLTAQRDLKDRPTTSTSAPKT